MKVWPGTTTYNKKELKGESICSTNSLLEKFAQKFGRGRGRAGLSYGFLTQMRSYPQSMEKVTEFSLGSYDNCAKSVRVHLPLVIRK